MLADSENFRTLLAFPYVREGLYDNAVSRTGLEAYRASEAGTELYHSRCWYRSQIICLYTELTH